MKRVSVVLLMASVLVLALCLVACTYSTYTVTFNANYEGGENVSMLIEKGKVAELPAMQRAGYTLAGWYMDAECATPLALVDGKTPVVKADATYYAKWEKNGIVPADNTGDDNGDNTGNTPGDTQTPNEGNDPAGEQGDTPDQTGEKGGNDAPAVILAGIEATYAGAVKRGAPFDKDSITVTATYSDGSTKTVRDYRVSSAFAAMNDANSVVVRYTEDDVTKECNMSYDVQTELYTDTPADTRIYFTNAENWSTVNAYLWRDDGAGSVEKAAWPGEACTLVQQDNGYGQQVYAVDFVAGYDKIIFNNGSQQTVDIVLSAGVNGYYTTDKDSEGHYNVGTYQMNLQMGNVTTYEFTNLGTWAKDGKKKVFIYTPAGYNAADSRQYKVLYMLDGQNLFDGVASVGRSWGVNAALADQGVQCVVVGVDNGEEGNWRNTQLTMAEDKFGPLSNLTKAGVAYGMADETALYQNGTLDELGDFIRNTLMPYINTNYRVYTGREDTMIAGSSSGGLAAFYLGLRDADLYSTVGAFSPATGLFDLSTWQQYLQRDEQMIARMYPQAMFIYCGYNNAGNDYGEVLENQLYDYDNTAGACKLQSLLADTEAYTDLGAIKTLFTAGATHNEDAWRVAFAQFVAWAFDR